MLGKLSVPGRPINLDYSRARPTVLEVGAEGGCLDNFSLVYHVYHFSLLYPSLWEAARFRLKYCFKGPFSLKQPTNQLAVKPKTTNQPTRMIPARNMDRTFCKNLIQLQFLLHITQSP